MYNYQVLKLYLNAIDVEKVKVIKKLLPFYRLGLKFRRCLISDLQIHTGYGKTIERYMENPKTLSNEELLWILSLYDISDIPAVEPILFDQYLIRVVPEPRIEVRMADIVYTILSVPEPRIEVEVLPSTRIITFIPEPRVEFTPIINIQYLITFVPELIMEIERIIVVQQYLITLVPEPSVQVHPVPVSGSPILFGVDTAAVRPSVANFGILASMLINPIPSNLTITFPNAIGFYVLAIPFTAPIRTQWYVDNLNRGSIGGSVDPVFGNAWPAPIMQTFNGVPYNVYIGNYNTLFSSPVTFMDAATVEF